MAEYTLQPSPIRGGSGPNASVPIYREIDWEPTLTCQTPGDLNVVYAKRIGKITQIGREVLVECEILTTTFTHSTAASELRITGIPSAYSLSTTGFKMGSGIFGGGITANTNYKYLVTVLKLAAAGQDYIAFVTAEINLGGGPGLVALGITDVPSGTNQLIYANIKYSLDRVI